MNRVTGKYLCLLPEVEWITTETLEKVSCYSCYSFHQFSHLRFFNFWMSKDILERRFLPRILAEVFRQARTLWPLNSSDAEKTVLLRIDVLKEVGWWTVSLEDRYHWYHMISQYLFKRCPVSLSFFLKFLVSSTAEFSASYDEAFRANESPGRLARFAKQHIVAGSSQS